MRKIAITMPIIPIKDNCTRCGKWIESVTKAKVFCNYCKSNFDFYPRDRYGFKHKIIDALEDENEVQVTIKEDKKAILNNIIHHINRHKNWDISDIERIEDWNDKQFCKECAVCNICMQCKNCKEVFKKKKEGVCPKCNSKAIKRYWFKKPLKVRKIEKCPICKSPDISHSEFRNLDACPKCGSENVTQKKKIWVLSCIIKRLPRSEI